VQLQASGGGAPITSGYQLDTFTMVSAFTGLAVNTEYDIYTVAIDDEPAPNIQATPHLLTWTTVADGYHLIFIAGQSNVVGLGPIEVGVDDVYTGLGGAKQFGFTSQAILDATNPIEHANPSAGTTGLWLTAVMDLVASDVFTKPILLVPVAYGGTNIASWQPGQTNYDAGMASLNAALALNANNTLDAVFWHQGEDDAAIGNTTYLASLTNIQNSLIADVTAMTSNTPFIVGEISAGGTTSERAAINTDLRAFAVAANAGAFAVTSDLPLIGDNIHFSAIGLRELGTRYALGYLMAVNGFVTSTGSAIAIDDNTTAPDYIHNGLPYAGAGLLAVDDGGTIARVHQSIPFTANGRIAASINGTVATKANGALPYTSTGLLALGTSAPHRVSSGFAYTLTRQIAVTV